MAPLSDAELGMLVAWVAQGAPAPPAPSVPDGAATQVGRWEVFLNGTSLKKQITARYLYGHWFVAHLYFEDLPAGPFFRIVRSKTPPGVAIDETRIVSSTGALTLSLIDGVEQLETLPFESANPTFLLGVKKPIGE